MTAPTVSAVIPVHNGEAYLADAISSTLMQTQPPTEVIVIDDGSTDATPDVVRQFGDQVRYVRQDQSGVSAARNHGARLARGELLAFLDHDDAWLPAKLERQIAAMEAEHATMSMCAVRVVDASGAVLRTARVHTNSDLVSGMLLFDGTETVSCSSTGVFRRAEFLSNSGFDPQLSTSADWDLLVRMLLGGSLAYVDEVLVVYRVHGSNMSKNIGTMERDAKRAFAKLFLDPRLPDSVKRRRRTSYGRLYRMLAGSYRDTGDWPAALRSLLISFWHDPRIAVELIRHVTE